MRFLLWVPIFIIWSMPAFAQAPVSPPIPGASPPGVPGPPSAMPPGVALASPPDMMPGSPPLAAPVPPQGVAPADANPGAPVAPAAADATAPDQASELDRLLSYKSVMYSEPELQKIKEILEAMKSGAPLPGETPIRTGSTDSMPEDYYYFPQFYLTSIVYYSPDFWVLWVNNKKITSANKDIITGLTITGVSSNQAEFRYAFLPEDRADFSIKPEDERVALNAFNRSATFMLHANQTFSSYNWKIYEGKVQRAKQDINARPELKSEGLPNISEVFPTPPESAPSARPASTTVPSQPKDKSTGFEGLMNRNNNVSITSP